MADQVLGQVGALGSAMADVAVQRERNRLLRLRRVAAVLAVVAGWLLVRTLLGNSVVLGPPHIPPGLASYLPAFLLVLLGSIISRSSSGDRVSNAAQQAASNEPSEPLAELGVAPGASDSATNNSSAKK